MASEAARYALAEVSSFKGASSATYLARHAAAWALVGTAAQEAVDWLSAVTERLGQPLLLALTALATARSMSKSGTPAAVSAAVDAAEAAVDSLPQPAYLAVLLEQLRGSVVRPGPAARLSPAELRVLEALGRGGSRAEVARQLHVSVNTIKTQQRVAYRKLGVSTRSEALALARARGLIGGHTGEHDVQDVDQAISGRVEARSPRHTA